MNKFTVIKKISCEYQKYFVHFTNKLTGSYLLIKYRIENYSLLHITKSN